MILVTGGAGFIGSNFLLEWFKNSTTSRESIVNLDALTYAGNRENLKSLDGDSRHVFVSGDICDRALIDDVLSEYRPRAIINFAAETHVDRSIAESGIFVATNVLGIHSLLEAALVYWGSLSGDERKFFRFVQVSTDEVYGSLVHGAPSFVEGDRVCPNNPYSASKAAAEHLVRAWWSTYGLPTLTVNPCNNYGPRQHREKLIPKVIWNALTGMPIPIFGDGQQMRSWLHVRDNCRAIRAVLEFGLPGESYNIGPGEERSNADIVSTLCTLLDKLHPHPKKSYSDLVTNTADRPGHDRRYALNCRKIFLHAGWRQHETLSGSLEETIIWYLETWTGRSFSNHDRHRRSSGF